MSIASAVILASGGGQIATLIALESVKKDISYIQHQSKDRYSGTTAAQNLKLQNVIDDQQNLNIQENKSDVEELRRACKRMNL